MASMHIKKDDHVVVIAGKDKGKKGKVLMAIPKKKRVVVEKVNILTKHTRPRKQGQGGGIIHQEGPINASNVMLVCEKCKKATRVGYKMLNDGSKARVCKKCGETFEN
jgi:large subunit ribosomal protein L24